MTFYWFIYMVFLYSWPPFLSPMESPPWKWPRRFRLKKSSAASSLHAPALDRAGDAA